MRPEKESIARELKEKVEAASFFILADYQGLNVTETETLRGKLVEADARMMVIRNRQFKHVLKEMKVEGVDGGLNGPTALFYGDGDVVEVSKVLKSFARTTQKPVVKLGLLEGRIISADDVNELATLPSLDQLRSSLVGTLAAPMTQLAGVFNQKLASLVYVLKAAEEKKSKGE
jgi:large subunit ribosomal protein L10